MRFYSPGAMAAALLGLCLIACSTRAPESCDTGDEGCECYPNNSCNGSLECRSKHCVDTGTSSDSDDSASDDSASDDSAADDSSGDDSAADDSSGDDSAADDSSDDSAADDSSDDSAADDSSDDSAADDSTADDSTADDSTADDSAADDSTIDNNAPTGTPVSLHGKLSVVGTNLVDENGKAIQLKGVSSMWLNWDDKNYSQSLEGLRYMRDSWGLEVFRAAMGVAEDGAYLENPSKANMQVRTIIDHAIELGVYVIVDWHDHNAEDHASDAQAFFDEISQEYGDVPNVLYELYNEPLDVSWSSVLKPYHQALIDVIRDNDPDNVIIAGTPNWSQDVDVAAGSKLSGSNLMYTLHFYACSHGASLMSKAQSALNSGLPIFVTEWGASHADGGVDGVVCESEARAWHQFLDDNLISWAAWKLDGCTDSTCFFKSRSVGTEGGWTSNELNGHASLVIDLMGAEAAGPDVVVEDPSDDDTAGDCAPSGSCASGTAMTCVDGEPTAASCEGCDVLWCGVTCCDHVGAFGANSVPDYADRNQLVQSFDESSESVEASFSFDVGSLSGVDQQIGVLAFALNTTYSVDPFSVLIGYSTTGSSLGRVTVSLEDGDAGCAYDTYSDSGYLFLLGAYACWNGFDEYSAVRQINVRQEAEISGDSALSVNYVSW